MDDLEKFIEVSKEIAPAIETIRRSLEKHAIGSLFSISMFLVVVFFELFCLSGRKPSLLGEPRRDAAFLGKSGGHALPLIPIVIVARLPVSEPARIDLVFPGNALPAVAVVTQGANTGFAHSRDVRHRADSRPFEA